MGTLKSGVDLARSRRRRPGRSLVGGCSLRLVASSEFAGSWSSPTATPKWEDPLPVHKLRCQALANHTSYRRYLTSSSTFCVTTKLRSRIAASSPNHGFTAPESSSLEPSRFILRPTLTRGNERFLILSALQRTIRTPCPSVAQRSLRWQIQEVAIGFEHFLELCACRWTAPPRILQNPRSLSSHSTDSHLS